MKNNTKPTFTKSTQQRNHKNINLPNKSINKSKTDGKSLLQKITNHVHNTEKQNHVTGKILITKLNDFVQNKCQFGINCAHLRATAQCHFLHQKKDFQTLGVPLPEKYLQNQEPLKKSKQQRKQDKIRQRAQRQKRLQQKQQFREQQKNYRERQQHQDEEQKPQKKQQRPAAVAKKVQQKIMDKKQLVIQKIIKPAQGFNLTLGHIFEQLNLVTDAICQGSQNIYSQQFNIQELKLTFHEVRKRLLMKFKKNKQYEVIQKLFVEKQSGLVKKLIKNITVAYKDMIEQVSNHQKWTNVDLRQIQQTFNNDDINRVLNLKKQNAAIIQYYSRFFSQQYGYPISFQLTQEQKQNQQKFNPGNLLPITKYQFLPIICPSFNFQRLFVSLNISFIQLKSLSQFASLMIPQTLVQKAPVRKTFTIDIQNITYTKFVDQIMTQHLTDYHQKIKGPAKQFQFGKIQQNLTKYRTFLAKYKAKISTLNKQNSFVLVVYNIKQLLQKVQSLQLEEHLDYDKIKKDRTMDEQNTYERLFLIRQFISIMGENDSSKLKVIYVTPQKKFKSKIYKAILQSIDKVLAIEQKQEQKMDVQA